MSSASVRTDRYSRGAIAFHWTIALLVIINLTIGLFHESLLEGLALMPIHKAVGVTVLVLSLARLLWRLSHPAPPLPASVAGWERGVSKTVQAIFYFLIIAMPLTGWLMVSGSPTARPFGWFGLFDVPLLPTTKALSGGAHEFHEIAGILFAVLVVLHIAGALRHHLLLRDRVLDRMLGRTSPSN